MLLSIQPCRTDTKVTIDTHLRGGFILLWEMTRGATAERGGTTMRKVSAPIFFGRVATRRTTSWSARFSIAMKKSNRVFMPFIKDGSSVETRRFTSLVLINTATTCTINWRRN